MLRSEAAGRGAVAAATLPAVGAKSIFTVADGGAALGKCLQDSSKHEAPTEISADCQGFIARRGVRTHSWRLLRFRRRSARGAAR